MFFQRSLEVQPPKRITPINNKKVVIIGANFAGLSAAGQLTAPRLPDSQAVDVSLIDPRVDFEWTPNIHELLSGIKTRSSIRLSRPLITQRLGHEFIQDEVAEIDVKNSRVDLKRGGKKRFDACLIACGHVSNSLGIEGVNKHSIAFRTADDVARIRQRIDESVANGKKLKLVIVGGGFSGVEALGEILRKYAYLRNVSICVIEPSSRLLHGLPEVVARDVIKLAKSRDVEFLMNRQITSIDGEGLNLDGGGRLDAGLVIWTAGTELPNLVTKADLDSVGRRGIPVTECLQSVQYEPVFVAGDAADFSTPLRKQAYHALDMGTLAGINASNWLNDKPLQTFNPLEKPITLAFGDLNTYLIQGQTVIASPLLASVKEAVYQLYMAQLSMTLPLEDLSDGVAHRFLGSVQNMLIPELSKLKLLNLLRQSRLLQVGNVSDIETVAKVIYGSVFNRYRTT